MGTSHLVLACGCVQSWNGAEMVHYRMTNTGPPMFLRNGGVPKPLWWHQHLLFSI